MGFIQQGVAVLALMVASAVDAAPDIVVVGLLPDRAVLKVEGETRILKVGESTDNITLIRVDANQATLKVGKTEQVLGLGQDHPKALVQDTTAKASLDVYMNARNSFETTGMINGRIVNFIVDTGASTVAMSRTEATRLGIDFRQNGQPAAGVTASGTVAAWSVFLDRVKVGPIVVVGVPAMVLDTEDSLPILLGMSFLSRVNITHEGNKLRLTAR